jgi:parallel beta-helix repeat protein
MGAESGAAPRSQAITRARIGPWRKAASSAGWLFGGVLTGAALWAGLSRASLDRIGPDRISFSTERRIVAAAADPHAIARVLSAAQPGDTIEIPPGEYLGPIELRDEISLVSRKPGAAVIRVDPDAVMDAGIAFAARHTRRGRLTGFRVVGTQDSPLATGILLDGANFEIDDVEISGAGDCAIRVSAGAAPTIRSSNLHDNGGCGIWIGSGSSPRLVGNRISHNGNILAGVRAGIEIHPPVAALIEGNIITSNGQPNLEDEIRRANVVDPPTPEIR